jgi:adenylate cyclase
VSAIPSVAKLRDLRHAVSSRLGGVAAKWDPALALLTRALLIFAVVVANIVGAIVVVVGAVWVLPTPPVEDFGEVRLVNLVAAGIYLLVALPIGVLWGNWALRGVLAAARQERDPSDAERRLVLRGPVRIGLRMGFLWAVAAVLFAVLNLRYSGLLAFEVAITVALAGVTTSAVGYLLTERILRPITARVLKADVPGRPEVPGVAARALLAWALGTAVPVLGAMLVALFALGLGGGVGISVRELAVTILGLGGVALVIGLLATALAARAAADPVLSVRDALSQVEEGELDVEVAVYDGTEVGLLQAGFNRMVAGLRDRDRIREAFGTYVDRDVAEHILEEGTSFDGEEVEVTMMFVDVRDFTGFAEGRSATETVASLNRMFERVVPIVHRHEGHVDKFVGDGLLAVFGAPRRQDDHAERALRTALEITESLGEDAELELEIGIGLNTGRVIAGNVGGGGRLEFSVIGDAVNVAARVESCTRETGDAIMATESTKEALAGRDFEFEERSEVELKGKREPVALYAVRAGQGEEAGDG